MIYAEGRLQPSTWTDKNGGEKHGLTLLAWHVRLSQIGLRKRHNTPGASRVDLERRDGELPLIGVGV